MAVFVAAVLGIVFYFILTEGPPNSLLGLIVLVTVAVFVEGIMLWLLASFYRTTYTLTDTELIVKAPRLIGGTKTIPLDTVTSAQRTVIPFGVRLFGASFYGGHYYFPSVRRAFMVITNYRDGGRENNKRQLHRHSEQPRRLRGENPLKHPKNPTLKTPDTTSQHSLSHTHQNKTNSKTP